MIGNSCFYRQLQYSRISVTIVLKPGCNRNTQEASSGGAWGWFREEIGVKLIFE